MKIHHEGSHITGVAGQGQLYKLLDGTSSLDSFFFLQLSVED